MRADLEQFAALYQDRPIEDNVGGMNSSHLFPMWYVLRALKPKVVIESGVWRGQGTWFIEQACPDAEVFCIDINWGNLVYRSQRATYLSTDFDRHDWNHIDREEAVVFFDDHVNAFKRCMALKKLGFRHLLFEDNYATDETANVYSLKLAFLGTGFTKSWAPRAIAGRLLGRRSDRTERPNSNDADLLRDIIDVYEELPPIFKTPETRWGDAWDDERYPTPKPLLESVARPFEQVYLDEATGYTWLCYVKLNDR